MEDNLSPQTPQSTPSFPILLVLLFSAISLMAGILIGKYFFSFPTISTLPTANHPTPLFTPVPSLNNEICQTSVYVNPEHGYSTNYYPNYWGSPHGSVTFSKTDQQPDGRYLVDHPTTYLSISRWKNYVPGTTKLLSRESIINSRKASPSYHRTEITLGDKPATQITYRTTTQYEHSSSFNDSYSVPERIYETSEIFTLEDSNHSMLVLTYMHPQTEPTLCSFDQILSSFTFINPLQGDDTRIYSNSKYSF